MSNHPNRSKDPPAGNPKPPEIIALREQAGLTQTEAAALVFTTCRVWQQWEAGDRRMHPAFWELFSLKTRRSVARSVRRDLAERNASAHRELIAKMAKARERGSG